MKLENKVVWITGGAKRIGRELALTLARRGMDIAIHCRHSLSEAQALQGQIEALGRAALVMPGDLSRPAEIRAMAERIAHWRGRLDVLINNASNFERWAVEDVTEAIWDRSLDVNLKGAFFCAQAAVGLMRNNPPSMGPWGKIINIGDAAASRPYPNHLPYMIAKAGLETMTAALALELAPHILVNTVAPGMVLPPEEATEEELQRAVAHVPVGRIGSPEDVIAAVLFVLEGGDYLNGQTIRMDGGRSVAQPPRR